MEKRTESHEAARRHHVYLERTIAKSREVMRTSPNGVLLEIALQTAVPLWILKMKQERWSWERHECRAQECADIVASEGDNIMYRSKVAGKSARAFNALAEGLALMAFCPGGVTALGAHWQAAMEA